MSHPGNPKKDAFDPVYLWQMFLCIYMSLIIYDKGKEIITGTVKPQKLQASKNSKENGE